MPAIKAAGKDDLNGFKPLPEGDYRLVIVKAKDKNSKAGNPMTALQCEVIDSKPKRIVFENLTWTEASIIRITSFWLAIGHKVNEGDEINFEASDLVGSEFEAHLGIDEYLGEKRNKIAYYLFPDRDKSKKGNSSVGKKDSEPTDITF